MNAQQIFGLLILPALVLFTACGPKSTPPVPPAAAVNVVISSLPYYVTNPGTYRLEKDLAGQPDGYGIFIHTNNVVLNLNGKELRGGPRSGTAIIISKSVSNVVVFNGKIAEWGFNAINAPYALHGVFSNLTVISNTMGVAVGSHHALVNCDILFNVALGLSGQDRIMLTNCRAIGNADNGFTIGIGSVLDNCEAHSNRINGFYGTQNPTFINCKAYGNSRSGYLGGPSTIATQCEAIGNKYEGMELASGALVRYCLAQSNLNNGIHVFGHSTVVSNKVIGNKRDGIRMVFNNKVMDNYLEGNATAGSDTSAIHPILKLNRIERNEIVIGEAIGIKASTAPTQILQNVVRHTLASGGIGYDCKKENLAVPVQKREKMEGDPATTNYELFLPAAK